MGRNIQQCVWLIIFLFFNFLREGTSQLGLPKFLLRRLTWTFQHLLNKNSQKSSTTPVPQMKVFLLAGNRKAAFKPMSQAKGMLKTNWDLQELWRRIAEKS